MSVAGKTKDDWIAQTFCDFGEPGRKDVITQHFFIETAKRGFQRVSKIYSQQGWHCWQEDRDGNVLQGEKPCHGWVS